MDARRAAEEAEARRQKAKDEWMNDETLTLDFAPPTYQGPQNVKDEDIIADPGYKVHRGFFSKAYSTFGLNIKNEPYRRTFRASEMLDIKAKAEAQARVAAEKLGKRLMGPKLRDGETAADLPDDLPVFGVERKVTPPRAARPPPPKGPPPGHHGGHAPPMSPIHTPKSTTSSALARSKSLPTVTIAGPAPGYEGDVGPFSRLTKRPALGFERSSHAQAAIRKAARRRALVGRRVESKPGALRYTRVDSETDEEAIKRRVLWSLGNQVLACPMMGITTIPGIMRPTLFPQLGCLRELYLADNKIEDFDSEYIRTVRTLHVLVLKRNRMKYLHEDFGLMTRLTKLDLSENQLHALPVGFSLLTNMVTMDLSNNHLVNAPGMAFPKMTSLNLSWNLLNQLPLDFDKCHSLTDLNLSHNVLMSLTIFRPVVAEPDPNLAIVVDDWETVEDPWTGALSYSNTYTGKASRADPAKLLAAAQQQYIDAWEYVTTTWDKEDEMPAEATDPKLNWEEGYDTISKTVYWYNRVTGESVWERPADLPPETESDSDTVETSSSEEEPEPPKDDKSDLKALAARRKLKAADEKDAEEAAARAKIQEDIDAAKADKASFGFKLNQGPSVDKLDALQALTAQRASDGRADVNAALTAAAKGPGAGVGADGSNAQAGVIVGKADRMGEARMAAAVWEDKKSRPRRAEDAREAEEAEAAAAAAPRSDGEHDDDDDDQPKPKPKRKSKKKKKVDAKYDHTKNALKAAKGRAHAMRALCLMHQGRGEWETVQDRDTGTVQYRFNITKDLYSTPPGDADCFGRLTSLTRLRLSHNKLSILSDSFGDLVRLETLLVDNNMLHPDSFVPSFGGLGLTLLTLEKNVCRRLPAPISHLKYLTHLDLRDNKMGRIESKLLKLTSLKTLYLSQNRIHSFPTTFKTMTNLTHLEIGDNPLGSEWSRAVVKGIPHIFFLCRQVENEKKHQGKPPEMQYASVGIAEEATVAKAELDIWMRDMFRRAQRSAVLKLQFKSLTVLPSEVFHLQDLRELKIVGNFLTTIGPELKYFCHLRHLLLNSNRIEHLHDDVFESMSSLRDLHLTENRLTRLPSSITKVTTLISLHVSANKLETLPDSLGKNMPSLTALWVDGNQLTKLPDTLGSFTTLKLLCAHNNMIESLPASMRYLTAVRQVRLQNNKLKDFPRHIMHLTTMNDINLASNRIRKIPQEFLFNAMSMSLRKLHLQNNLLVEMPLGIHWMSRIVDLRIDNNPPLRSPPQSVALGGVSDIFAYSAIRSRNVRHLVDKANDFQFVVNRARLTPFTGQCLTGGLGLLTNDDLDEWDEFADKLCNTECDKTTPSTIPAFIESMVDRRTRYFKNLLEPTAKKFYRALELTEQLGWADAHNFSTRVMRPFGPRKKMTRCYSVSFEALFGKGLQEGDLELEYHNCISARIERRMEEGDATCAGPRLTPMLVATALNNKRALLGPVCGIGDWVDYHQDSPDFVAVEVEAIKEPWLKYYTYDEWNPGEVPPGVELEQKPKALEEDVNLDTDSDEDSESEAVKARRAAKADVEERKEYEGFVRPSRLKFSARPAPFKPPTPMWRPRPKLSFTHCYHDWTAVDLEAEVVEQRALEKVRAPIEEDAKWAWRTLEGQQELADEKKFQTKDVSTKIDVALRAQRSAEVSLTKANQLAVQRLHIRQTIFKALGQVKWPGKAAKQLRSAVTKVTALRAFTHGAAGGSLATGNNTNKKNKKKKTAKKSSNQEIKVDPSGGGEDDAARQKHLAKVWRVGMEASASKVEQALASVGLTREDTTGIDRDIFTSIKEVLRYTKEAAQAKADVERHSNNPVNKTLGPAYTKHIVDLIVERQVDSACRRVVKDARMRGLRKGIHRWWDGADGAMFHDWQKQNVSVYRNSAGTLTFVDPVDPNFVAGTKRPDDDSDDDDDDKSSTGSVVSRLAGSDGSAASDSMGEGGESDDDDDWDSDEDDSGDDDDDDDDDDDSDAEEVDTE